jgi:hypothetical protein
VKNRNTQLAPDAPAQADHEPNHSAQEPAKSDATASMPLEERLRRLEAALAQAPDPGQIESRIAERVTERLSQHRPIPVAQIAPVPAPPTQGTVTIPSGVLLNVGKQLLNTTAGIAKAATTTTSGPHEQESAAMHGIRRTFWFFDTLTELRAMWCMFTDPRYSMSWAGRLVPIGLLVFLLTSSFLVPGAQLTGIGTVIDKVADIIPAYILYKWLSFEARRYRETAPDLPPELRL